MKTSERKKTMTRLTIKFFETFNQKYLLAILL
jgi:hypothetical protein